MSQTRRSVRFPSGRRAEPYFEAGEARRTVQPNSASMWILSQDAISRLGPLVILKTRRKLSHGHKNMHALLVRLWCSKQKCCPSYEWLASSLGISLRSAKMLIEDLE